jgi:dihydrofolate reductase
MRGASSAAGSSGSTRSPPMTFRGRRSRLRYVIHPGKEGASGYLLAQGGVRFARSLVETGLIDEYRLVVHPVVLGAGERLFTAPLTIEPMSTTAFSRGAVAHVFTAHP